MSTTGTEELLVVTSDDFPIL